MTYFQYDVFYQYFAVHVTRKIRITLQYIVRCSDDLYYDIFEFMSFMSFMHTLYFSYKHGRNRIIRRYLNYA